VQEQFILDPDQVYMNIGTTGAMPLRVLENYDKYNRVIARHPNGFRMNWAGNSGLVKRGKSSRAVRLHKG
jgi:hypothetical protein